MNHLIEETLAANPGVDVARARVREARANLRQQTATGLPTTGTTAAYLRTGNVSSLLGGAPAVRVARTVPAVPQQPHSFRGRRAESLCHRL